MNITATDLIHIQSALAYTSDRIRNTDAPGDLYGPQYRRSVEMETLAARVSEHLATMPAGVTVEAN